MNPERHISSEALAESLDAAGEAHLAKCERCLAQRDALLSVRRAIGAMPRVAAPPNEAVAMLRDVARRARRTRIAGATAVAVALVALAVVVLRSRSNAPFSSTFMDEIALDHLHYKDNPSPAQYSGSRDEVAAWFASTLGHPMRLSRLEATDILGGRNCYLHGKYAALVLAERAHHRLSLFDIPSVSVRRAGCASAQGVRLCAIPDPDGGSRVLAGDLPEEEMMRLLAESL
jgi:hypothetical protein